MQGTHVVLNHPGGGPMDLQGLFIDSRQSRGGGGGIPGNLWFGGAARFSKTDQNFLIFHTRFQTWPLIHTRFQTWRRQKLCSLERQQKDFLNEIVEFAHCSFFLNLFGTETTDTFIHSGSSKTIPDYMGKVNTRFLEAPRWTAVVLNSGQFCLKLTKSHRFLKRITVVFL